MKTTILILILLLSGITFAQNDVIYTYDDAGNRIKREVIVSPNLLVQNGNSEATAIENIEGSGIDLDAHPNPTQNETDVAVIMEPETVSEEHKAALTSGVQMQLLDTKGRVLKTKQGTSLEQSFDLQGFSNGVYFVKVYTERGELVGERKIVKE